MRRTAKTTGKWSRLTTAAVVAATLSTAVAGGVLLADAGSADASETVASAPVQQVTLHRPDGLGNDGPGDLFVLDNVTDAPITITYSACGDPAVNCPWDWTSATPGPDYIPAGGQDRFHVIQNWSVDSVGQLYINGKYGNTTMELRVPANPDADPTLTIPSDTGYYIYNCDIYNPLATPVPVVELFSTPSWPNHCG